VKPASPATWHHDRSRRRPFIVILRLRNRRRYWLTCSPSRFSCPCPKILSPSVTDQLFSPVPELGEGTHVCRMNKYPRQLIDSGDGLLCSMLLDEILGQSAVLESMTCLTYLGQPPSRCNNHRLHTSRSTSNTCCLLSLSPSLHKAAVQLYRSRSDTGATQLGAPSSLPTDRCRGHILRVLMSVHAWQKEVYLV
jgi:hypothetical protein